MPTIMRGATNLREYVMTYLENKIPTYIEQARIDWGLDTHSLPEPKTYSRYEPRALSEGKYPFIAINVVNADNFNRNDFTDNMEEQYQVKYTVRIYVWIKTPVLSDASAISPALDSAIRLRDDYASLIRSVLLLSMSLENANILWDEKTLSEEYSDVEPVKGDRYVCGAILNLEIGVDESLSRNYPGSTDKVIGNANTINVLTSNQLPPL